MLIESIVRISSGDGKGRKVAIEGATLIDENIIVLPIAQSGSHQNEPVFFKYSYYHPPGSSYIINPFIEVEEVDQFINKVGPSSSIAKMKTDNSYLEEVAILDPKVFVDPSLENELYPPLKKVVHGTFEFKNEEDIKVLESMTTDPKKTSYIQQVNGKKLYKMFLPTEDGQVIYIAFDYGEMSQPLNRQSKLISVAGFVSLIVLYLITSQFFKRIYQHIDLLVSNVGRISNGEYGLATVSDEQYEFRKLTESINQMSLSLHESFQKLSNEKLFREQILASIPIGIITVHNQNSEIELNWKAIELTRLDEVEIKRVCKEKVTCEVNTEFWNLFCSKKFFQTKKVSFKTLDKVKMFLVSQSPLVDDKEKIIGRNFQFVDVSEMDQLEKRILRTEKLALAGELASRATHEIKNPLSVIRGFIQLMAIEFTERDRNKYHMSLLLKEIERINIIAQDMLMLAKPSLNMKKANLDDVIEEIIPLIRANYSSNILIRAIGNAFYLSCAY
ncbi:histidine kinase dimerization/phospho-acceptor domain-containing protein [Halalkalibacter alkalisediminis]|uniref:histidine kinase n=1 Tax=Halalkalibacter alkalisediminis TaxID=935616 RepID=A0ABV6NJ80_9BACI|nr:histidine kinase dimerization/phospho-acceptor domain-containing protein [Halalkalibacter alkalisediminis]